VPLSVPTSVFTCPRTDDIFNGTCTQYDVSLTRSAFLKKNAHNGDFRANLIIFLTKTIWFSNGSLNTIGLFKFERHGSF
jgi:hypothetical protein